MMLIVIPVVIGALCTVTKSLGKGTKGLANERTSVDHPNDRIIKISQNTEKSPGHLRGLAVIPTAGENVRKH